MNNTEIIESTKKWVEQFVIAHQLCPFAAHPFQNGRIRFIVVDELLLEKQLMAFYQEIIFLEKNPTAVASNSLVIFPKAFHHFLDYLDFFELAEQLLEAENKNGKFQLASFHPKYLFEGSSESDASNYTNRSPFPVVHILRTNEVSAAIENHPDIDSIPLKNIELMNTMGVDELKKILSDIKGAK